MNLKFFFGALLPMFCSATVFAANPSAATLAEKLFRAANARIILKDWKGADALLRRSVFLNTAFGAAEKKRTQLNRYLRHQAEREFRFGERELQSLQKTAARFHWDRARSFLVEGSDPALRKKIGTALKQLAPLPKKRGGVTKVSDQMLQKRVAMEEVKHFLESGDAVQAEMTLQNLLYRDPSDTRAQTVLQRLESPEALPALSGPAAQKSLSAEIEIRFAEGEKLFRQGREDSNRLRAWQFYRKGLDLFQSDDLKPPYYKELVSAEEKSSVALIAELQKKIPEWWRQISQTGKAAALHPIAVVLQNAIREYPPLPETATLLEEVYRQIASATEGELMRAKTTHELSGCRQALPNYRAVQREARFPQVVTWQEAEKNIRGCESGKGE